MLKENGESRFGETEYFFYSESLHRSHNTGEWLAGAEFGDVDFSEMEIENLPWGYRIAPWYESIEEEWSPEEAATKYVETTGTMVKYCDFKRVRSEN